MFFHFLPASLEECNGSLAFGNFSKSKPPCPPFCLFLPRNFYICPFPVDQPSSSASFCRVSCEGSSTVDEPCPPFDQPSSSASSCRVLMTLSIVDKVNPLYQQLIKWLFHLYLPIYFPSLFSTKILSFLPISNNPISNIPGYSG